MRPGHPPGMPGWGESDPGRGKDVFEVDGSRALEHHRSESEALIGSFSGKIQKFEISVVEISDLEKSRKLEGVRPIDLKNIFPPPGIVFPPPGHARGCPGRIWRRVWACMGGVWECMENH